jgi:hypothetical protein
MPMLLLILGPWERDAMEEERVLVLSLPASAAAYDRLYEADMLGGRPNAAPLVENDDESMVMEDDKNALLGESRSLGFY